MGRCLHTVEPAYHQISSFLSANKKHSVFVLHSIIQYFLSQYLLLLVFLSNAVSYVISHNYKYYSSTHKLLSKDAHRATHNKRRSVGMKALVGAFTRSGQFVFRTKRSVTFTRNGHGVSPQRPGTKDGRTAVQIGGS